MRSIEDKGILNLTPTHEISSKSAANFEFHKANGKGRTSQHRTGLGKPTPSKWDDAQKWLVNLSRGGEKSQSNNAPRNSNADDRRLIAPVPKKEDCSSSDDEELKVCPGSSSNARYEVETKKVDYDDSRWRVSKPENSTPVVQSICVRDMGTDMTPIASQEPSRATTPIRAMTPAAQSPISSRSSTPVRGQSGVQAVDNGQVAIKSTETIEEAGRGGFVTTWFSREREAPIANVVPENNNSDQAKKLTPLETRAMAWDEAERARYMARYKREEVKIQAWENHEKRKAEMEMKRMEVKAERIKSRAQERYTNKLASTRRIAEEKRANAESKLSEKAVQTSEKADYIRRTGHLPSSFSFKLPSCCW